ncbi:MAG TPA: hypothetical protein VJB34_00495 [Bdellovibrionota bacterium]|nr:hypothetical protein [Bdellovibrionota bacterium]
MKVKNILIAILIVPLILTLQFCSHSKYKLDTFQLPGKTTIAISSFENLTTYPRAGKIVAEIMTVELDKTKRFQIVEKNASYVLTGSISEYRYTKGLAEDPAVALQVKLIESRSGKVLWRGSVSDLSKESIFQRSASLDELTHVLCEKIAESLEVRQSL